MILRRFRLLVFDETVAENGTVTFCTSLTTKIFPLLTLTQYLIFYRLLNDDIEVLRVVSGYQDLTALFDDSL